MRKLLNLCFLIIGFVASIFISSVTMAAQVDNSVQETITISVYETPCLKVTKTLQLTN